jgi:hypothetical protein
VIYLWVALGVAVIVGVTWIVHGDRAQDDKARWDQAHANLVKLLARLSDSECRELCNRLAEGSRLQQEALITGLEADEDGSSANGLDLQLCPPLAGIG